METATDKIINNEALVNEISYPKISMGISVLIVNCSTGDCILIFLYIVKVTNFQAMSRNLSPQVINILNTNPNSNIVSTNSYKKNKMIVESYAAASMQATIELIIQTIKRNADITLKSCTKNWCSYYIPIETLTNKVKCEFIIAEKYKSKTGTRAAYDKFAAINGSLPDFTKISKAYTEHDDIILKIELE